MEKATLAGYLKASLDWFNNRWMEIQEVIDWNPEWIARNPQFQCNIPVSEFNPVSLYGALVDPIILALPYDKQYKSMDDFGQRFIIHNTPLGPVIFTTYPNLFTDGDPERFVHYLYDKRLEEYGFLTPVGFMDTALIERTLGVYNFPTGPDWPEAPLLLGQKVELALNYNKSK